MGEQLRVCVSGSFKHTLLLIEVTSSLLCDLEQERSGWRKKRQISSLKMSFLIFE